MIRTYLIHQEELEKISFPEELFSAQRREKIAKLKREQDKRLSACAELLLIYALRQQEDAFSLPLSIRVDERSKPALLDSPWQFNLSHSGDYAVCALSDAPVGVDIETFRVRELLHPERMLHPDEAKLLAFISNSNEKKKYFYECWVAKESYLKNLGIGLIVRPRDFMVSEDTLKILDLPYSPARGHHTEVPPASEQEPGKGDTTLHENLAYLQPRCVHVYEPGEVRGSSWKFDAAYKVAVCSMTKDPDNIARLVHAQDLQNLIN